MTQIYDLQQRAEVLRKKTATDSISPEEVGGLHADTLAYIANMERYASSLGIKKVYTSVSEMNGDESPVSSTGMPLKAGQLVTIFNAGSPDADNSGEIYAFQNPGWILVGRLDAGTADTLKKLIEGDKSTVTNNNRNAFVWLGNFETWDEAQVEIDKLHSTGEDNTKVGEFRLLLNGRNLIVYNYVQNWATGVFTQIVKGSIKWDEGSQTMDQSLSIHEYERIYNEGNGWGEWKIINNGSSTGISIDAIDILCSILSSAVYISDQTAQIEELREELKKGGGGVSVSRPMISQDYETYLVTMSSTDGDAVNIYYTTDGTTPTSASKLYTTALKFNEDCSIKAISINKSTGEQSSVATFSYVAKLIDYIEFADELVKTTLVSSTTPKIDTNNDGIIQKTEAANATSMPPFSTKEITSFDELEFFTGIETTPLFYQCRSLTSLKLPKAGKLKSTCDSFLYGSTSISSIEIPEGVERLGKSSFQQTSLSAIILPSSLISIGDNAFYGTKITRIVIPDSVTSIGLNAFNSCTLLEEITIGSSVASIGELAFYNCNKLNKIHLPDTPPTFTNSLTFPNSAKFYVKSQDIKEAYLMADTWADYGESRFIIE